MLHKGYVNAWRRDFEKKGGGRGLADIKRIITRFGCAEKGQETLSNEERNVASMPCKGEKADVGRKTREETKYRSRRKVPNFHI